MVAVAVNRAEQVIEDALFRVWLRQQPTPDPVSPCAFLTDRLGADLWAKQIEIADALTTYRRVAVKSCHASGKTFLSARLALWFLHTFEHSIVITTAPTNNQIRNLLWRELRAAHATSSPKLPGQPLQTEYSLGPDWYALGFKSDDTEPDRFQGFHAVHALVIIDEAAGVANTVYDALDSVLTSESAHLLLIGNPTNPTGTFYDAFHKDRALYHCITIAANDTPNIQAGRTVRPYLITQQWIDDAIAKHGEDSPYVQSRVHAAFPAIGDNTLIPLAWLEAADARRVDDGEWPVEAGVDVARFGGDESALCVRQGPRIVLQAAWSGADTDVSAGKVRHLLQPWPNVAAVKVDTIGVGAGVADNLRREGLPVVDVNVSAKATDATKWSNLRHELWWNLRAWFQEGTICGPLDDVSMGQLADIRYSYDSKHTMPLIEPKEKTKQRTHHSPDRAEAMMLAFAQVPHAPMPVFRFAAARRVQP